MPRRRAIMAFASAPAVAVMESTEIAPGARFYVGKFARRVSRRYQAYMRRKREAESLLRIIRHYTVRTVKAAVRMGKFARRVGKKYQAYMMLKRRIEDRAYAWFCNCRAPECCFCALTQRVLLRHLRGEGTVTRRQSHHQRRHCHHQRRHRLTSESGRWHYLEFSIC